MRILTRSLAPALSFLGTVALASSGPLPPPDPLQKALMDARPGSEALRIAGVTIERDALRLHLDEGVFVPLSTVASRVPGGVFLGKGRLEVTPSTETERRHLELLCGEKPLRALTETFTSAVLLFTDATWKELRAAPAAPVTDASAARDTYDAVLKAERKEWHTNFHLRILGDLMQEAAEMDGAFYAFLDGGKLPSSLAIYDPRGLPEAGLSHDYGTETTAFLVSGATKGGVWYASSPKGVASPRPVITDADALHYSVDTRIRKDLRIEGTTTVTARVQRDQARLLRFNLFPKLRVSSAALLRGDGAEEPLAVIQGDDDEDGDAAIVFPRPIDGGTEVKVRIAYAGSDVLDHSGVGSYVVGARRSWYPNLGSFFDLATFDLHYTTPRANTVVSVGHLVDRKEGEKEVVYSYRTPSPVRVAGFNYGDFVVSDRKDPQTGFQLRVFSEREGLYFVAEESDESVGRVEPRRQAESILVDAMNAVRLGTTFFGPLPDPDVSISQQAQWDFGQSWPGLVFLPYTAFVSSTERAQMGLIRAGDFVNTVGFHEMAHQWWGQHVGWGTYRDQWLCEGFAEFAAGLAVEATGGPRKARDFWKKTQSEIVGRGRGTSLKRFEAGPISLGSRLSSPADRGAYSLVYDKGAYVLQMLRSLFFEAKDGNHDARFIRMLKDFASTFAGGNPTTDDFRKVAERHAPAPYTGNLSWFFRQWVDGTDVPTLSQTFRVRDLGAGRYGLSGELSQRDVPEDFRSLVTLSLETPDGKLLRFASIMLVGTNPAPLDEEVSLPFAPKRLVANANLELLTRN